MVTKIHRDLKYVNKFFYNFIYITKNLCHPALSILDLCAIFLREIIFTFCIISNSDQDILSNVRFCTHFAKLKIACGTEKMNAGRDIDLHVCVHTCCIAIYNLFFNLFDAINDDIF